MYQEMTESKDGNDELQTTRLLLNLGRVIQFIFFAIFAYGIAWSTSDLAAYLNLPVTGWALGSIIFGILGVILSELQIRRLEAELFGTPNKEG